MILFSARGALVDDQDICLMDAHSPESQGVVAAILENSLAYLPAEFAAMRQMRGLWPKMAC